MIDGPLEVIGRVDHAIASELLDEIDNSLVSSPPPSPVPSPSTSPSVIATSSPSPSATSSTVHQNPNWLTELTANISEKIIGVCSQRTRHAVKENDYIEVNWGNQDLLKNNLFPFSGWFGVRSCQT